MIMLTSILNDVAYDPETYEFRFRPSGVKNWAGLATRIERVATAVNKDIRRFIAIVRKHNHYESGEEAGFFRCRIHVPTFDVIFKSVAMFFGTDQF